MNTKRCIYFMGPSGSGKDSIVKMLAQQSLASHNTQPKIYVAKRTIDRPNHSSGEEHESVTSQVFVDLEQAGAFAMSWAANGHQYGIRHAELKNNHASWTLINGSRAHWQMVEYCAQGMESVFVTASPENLRIRLLSRGREDSEAIEKRLARLANSGDMNVSLVLSNDSDLESACKIFWSYFSKC